MALNLGATLRDAVDGPGDGLDEVVGEDPADLDLPALSARIRRRRRAHAATRSAVGVAAAGAVALAGVHGLGSWSPRASRAGLSPDQAGLCGQDVGAMPTVADGLDLVPANLAVVSDGAGAVGVAGDPRNLGSLAGRTLTVGLSQHGGAAAADGGDLVLTTGSTVVAVGARSASASWGMVTDAGEQRVQLGGGGDAQSVIAVSVVAADLVPCPAAGGTPANVPNGTYTVQYLLPAAAQGGGAATPSRVAEPGGPAAVIERAAGGPWLVTLLDEPPAPTLPDGYPADEVPVVGGTLLSASRTGETGWTVRVAVSGDDAVTRVAAALRAAGADVTSGPTLPFVPPLGSSSSGDADPQSTLLTSLQAILAGVQARRDAAAAEVASTQQAYDALVAANADPDTMSWTARQLQAAKDGLGSLDQQVAQAQAQLDSVSAAAVQPAATAAPTGTYTVFTAASVTATSRTWSVAVSQSTDNGQTVLTYVLTKR